MLELIKVKYHKDIKKQLEKRFIAFDVETTGLNPKEERIIELGAVLFENGQAVQKFNTLVNAEVEVSEFISNLTHITNEMLENQPREEKAYKMFQEFMKEALQGEVLVCAHNAQFDMSFLKETFDRLQLTGKICYVDTLQLSRKYIHGPYNYKQGTIAHYLHIKNENAHRAYDDAYVCGQILNHIVKGAVKKPNLLD